MIVASVTEGSGHRHHTLLKTACGRVDTKTTPPMQVGWRSVPSQYGLEIVKVGEVEKMMQGAWCEGIHRGYRRFAVFVTALVMEERYVGRMSG